LKTDNGYPKDTGFTFFILVNPGNPLHHNTYQSAPPVSALAHPRGPRKRSQSPVDMLEHRDTYGQDQACGKGHQGSLYLHRPHDSGPPLSLSTKLWSDPVGARRRRGLRRRAPQRPQMGKKTNAPITPIRSLPSDSAPFGVINTVATRGGNESHSRGRGGFILCIWTTMLI